MKEGNANPMGDLMASLFGGGPTSEEWKLVDPVASSMNEAAGLD